MELVRSLFRPAALLCMAAIVSVIILGDALVAWRPAGVPPYLWALLDEPVHAALAVLVLLPLVTVHGSRPAWRWIVLAAITATAIDLDHFVSARSLSLIDAVQLPDRPVSHSLLVAAGASMLAYALTRRPLVGWIVLAALASHIVRDASTGATPLLWPLPAFSMPVWTYLSAELGLYVLTVLIAGVVSGKLASGHSRQQL